jgi:hypothetical protein
MSRKVTGQESESDKERTQSSAPGQEDGEKTCGEAPAPGQEDREKTRGGEVFAPGQDGIAMKTEYEVSAPGQGKMIERRGLGLSAPGQKWGIHRKAIPARNRHFVTLRDLGQCTWWHADNTRCTETAMLEFDHIVMVCRGGTNDVENLTLRCRRHNQYRAERELGREFMEHKRSRRGPKQDKCRSEAEVRDLRPPAFAEATAGTT